MPRRNIMRKFRISEISGVGVPAQEGATVSIIKSEEGRPEDPTGKPPVKKAGDLVDLLTGEEQGHQHGIDFRVIDGELALWVSFTAAEGADHPHDHQLARDGEGRYVISTVSGHTHDLDAEAVQRQILNSVEKEGEDDMKDANAIEKEKEELQKKLEDANRELETAKAVASLSALERAHYEGLDEAARTAYLAKEADARLKEAEDVRKQAEDADPVVYTTNDGIAIRKSAGELNLSLAKKADEAEKRNAELEKQAKQERYEKRADAEFSNLPGSTQGRAALLEAVDGIGDETMRKEALAAVTAGNTAMAPLFKGLGTSAGKDADADKANELKALAQKYAEEHDVSPERAMAAVVKTEEGARLYAKQRELN